MDTIKTLCEGQNAETRRRILAAYYLGGANGLKVSRGTSGVDVEQWIYVNLLEMWRRAQTVPGERETETGDVLLGLPRKVYERAQAAALAIERGTATEGERAILRQQLCAARQAHSEAMPGVRGETDPNAPRGLRQAAGGNLAVQAVSHEATQLEGYVPVMLRNQAE